MQDASPRLAPTWCCLLLATAAPMLASETTHRVPSDYKTVQAAIDAAADGDRVLVSPGVYRESLVIGGKSVKLCSEYTPGADPRVIERTVLSGAVPEDEHNEGRAEQVVLIKADSGGSTEIAGFTIEGGDDGVSCYATATICHNRFVNNVDAIDFEGGGGLCEHNLFERNEDDAIDLDQACAVVIQHNHIVDNLDDGIEIRLQPFQGEPIEILVRKNVIAGNAEDGIQIIDYPGLTDRRIRIEQNLILRNSMAGVGFMADANTREDYSAAAVPERVEVTGNSFVDNKYGLSGSGNLLVEGNSFTQHSAAAVRSAIPRPEANRQNLFWSNRTDAESP
ncbi:hypothetical protein KOR34_13650 [Posidoniimonas corsicana]|uniref:Right handed beta helix domain-containing protein n=1 Tax=Posidoniimonas corsicana TaxID=1938618 RepID=A0A5C5VEY1_9BACT|nr:right-handed parallel beta-helix repeat-containing protein [Posidoniimonas corsicana]TWT36459.1 hypothetical protein KOR34_13650 [Posidoniimonas corsicana]